ncbi:MAG: hypothetical protein CVT80_07115 [Alphaproteobacteria bacterium HGW-Alphaproteobacteria-2]|nr:MAG: hypothetical protein CVT80_07115 [Alphaproteobacteria bacterium HGW-Alphaproteobacteria-2]
MAEEQLDHFYQRLDRIAEQRRAGEAGADARPVGALHVGRHDRRARSAAPFRPVAFLGALIRSAVRGVVLLALLALGFKAGLIASMGLMAYETRLAEVTGGRNLDPVEERIAALLVPDRLSLRLYDGLLVAGVPEGWLADGTPLPQRGRSLPKRIQIGTGQANVPQLGVGER